MCKHYTKPTHTSHSRTRDFSRWAQDLSHHVNRNNGVSQNCRSHMSHSMSHTPSLLVPSHLSTSSFCTCSPFRPSIRPSTRPSLLSTRRFTMGGSIECVFRPPGGTTLAFSMWRPKNAFWFFWRYWREARSWLVVQQPPQGSGDGCDCCGVIGAMTNCRCALRWRPQCITAGSFFGANADPQDGVRNPWPDGGWHARANFGKFQLEEWSDVFCFFVENASL